MELALDVENPSASELNDNALPATGVTLKLL